MQHTSGAKCGNNIENKCRAIKLIDLVAPLTSETKSACPKSVEWHVNLPECKVHAPSHYMSSIFLSFASGLKKFDNLSILFILEMDCTASISRINTMLKLAIFGKNYAGRMKLISLNFDGIWYTVYTGTTL